MQAYCHRAQAHNALGKFEQSVTDFLKSHVLQPSPSVVHEAVGISLKHGKQALHCKNSMVTLTNKYGYLSSMFVLSMPGRCKQMQRMCKMCTQSSKKCGGLPKQQSISPLSMT